MANPATARCNHATQTDARVIMAMRTKCVIAALDAAYKKPRNSHPVHRFKMKHMQEKTPEMLMKLFQNSFDAESFEQIVRCFTSSALAAARQILSDQVLAEDAVQETFLRVVRARSSYNQSKAFSSWFYAILRNVCTDMLRSKSRQVKLIKAVSSRKSPQPHSPWDGLDVPELLEKLPSADQAVLTLRVIHEMAFKDIATVLGISPEAAKKRAQRSLRK
ncbi:MAG TPA: sigma-70 family RNA polymerase sigma factor, partial [Phycisphaerae bacterium]|nr:sigma-70 family RNA polymerase sigma factor [Phycisphaerae bacterium]